MKQIGNTILELSNARVNVLIIRKRLPLISKEWHVILTRLEVLF